MCIDYRGVNSKTAEDAYPIPSIEELVQEVADSTFITTLDLAKGYYQIPLAEQDMEKTAFVSPRGKFEFTVLPFGL